MDPETKQGDVKAKKRRPKRNEKNIQKIDASNVGDKKAIQSDQEMRPNEFSGNIADTKAKTDITASKKRNKKPSAKRKTGVTAAAPSVAATLNAAAVPWEPPTAAAVPAHNASSSSSSIPQSGRQQQGRRNGAGRGGAGTGRGRHFQKKTAHTPTTTTTTISGPLVHLGEEEGEVCLLCANPLQFVSVAPCGHSTCSLCAARLRLKSQDKQCVVCKRHAEFTIVYPFVSQKEEVQTTESGSGVLPGGYRTYESFNISAGEESQPLPGVVPNLRAQMLFVDCTQHSIAMDNLTSMSCAVCSQRCGSEKALFKHVRSAHKMEFCELCFRNRPLFPCEQSPMTAAQLKAHIDAPPGALVGSGGDKSGGHPPCRFCSEHFYDAHSLHVHMRDKHFTCHLCPAQFQQRFYKGISQLVQHLKDNHYTCSLCLESREMGGDGAHIAAYARRSEFAEHLRVAHNISSTSGSGRRLPSDHPLSLSSALSQAFPVAGSRQNRQEAVAGGRGGGDSGASSGVEYLDLNMSSADPYSTPLPERAFYSGAPCCVFVVQDDVCENSSISCILCV